VYARVENPLITASTSQIEIGENVHLSFIYSIEATLEEANASLDRDVQLSVPVIQVVGSRDEVWGSHLLSEYLQRFPNFRQYLVPEGAIHKDVFLKPLAFQQVLTRALREEFGQK